MPVCVSLCDTDRDGMSRRKARLPVHRTNTNKDA